jgi:hypothetical protein
MRIYLVILILALIIPFSQAYTMGEVSIIPSGSLAPGTQVTASFEIYFLESGLSTFPEGNSLQLVTDLDYANWTWWINFNGVGNSHPVTHGRVLQITSWDLTYHREVARESVRVLLEGTAPQVSSTQNKIIFDILELDRNYTIVKDSETQRISLVINPTDIPNAVTVLTTDLQILRTEINNKTSLGADTKKAEEKYKIAQQELGAANNQSQSRYPDAISHLTNAQSTIVLGMTDLNEAWVLRQGQTTQEEQAKAIALREAEIRKEQSNTLIILAVVFTGFAIGSIVTVIRYNQWKKAQKKEDEK